MKVLMLNGSPKTKGNTATALAMNTKMPLLVFGDWNDGPADAAPQIVQQGLSQDAALRRLSPEDSRGEEWTLYYKRGKEYCLYDQIFVNPLLRDRMRGQGGIIDIPAAARASDHRALWCDLR